MKRIVLFLLFALMIPCAQAQGHLFHIPNGMHAGPVGPFVGVISGKPRLTICVPGTCKDNFAGPAGQLLTVHNPAWVSATSSSPVDYVVLSGSGDAYAPAWSGFGIVYSSSTSDTAQITFKGSSAVTQDSIRQLCVRTVVDGAKGICMAGGFGSGAGGFSRILISDQSGFVCQSDPGNITFADDHVFHLSVSGTSPTTVTAQVDGVQVLSCTDSNAVPAQGSPSLILANSSDSSAYHFSNFQDF